MTTTTIKREARCPGCNALLFKTALSDTESKCRRCSAVVDVLMTTTMTAPRARIVVATDYTRKSGW